MKPTHELIDPDEPRCLYCGTNCDLELKGEWINKSRYDVEVLTCRNSSCKEIFEIHSIQAINGETSLTNFAFTCKNYLVLHIYGAEQFKIMDRKFLYRSLDQQFTTALILGQQTSFPAFDIDFSNKEKLWEKLKTYLIFS